MQAQAIEGSPEAAANMAQINQLKLATQQQTQAAEDANMAVASA